MKWWKAEATKETSTLKVICDCFDLVWDNEPEKRDFLEHHIKWSDKPLYIAGALGIPGDTPISESAEYLRKKYQKAK